MRYSNSTFEVMVGLLTAAVIGMLWASARTNSGELSDLEKLNIKASAWMQYSANHCEKVGGIYAVPIRIGNVESVFTGDQVSCEDTNTYTIGKQIERCAIAVEACRGLHGSDVPNLPIKRAN